MNKGLFVVILLIEVILFVCILHDINNVLNRQDQWENKCRALGGEPMSTRNFTHCVKTDSFIEVK